jgi:hypothetical protein
MLSQRSVQAALDLRPADRQLWLRILKGIIMAGGWARDGAVHDQIEASIADELARLKRPDTPERPSRK